MSSCEQDLSAGGLGEICLRNERLRVSILPDAGGKIAEIVDLATGRNWLWKNPDIPFARGDYGADFGATLDSGGWDEVLLSMSPAKLQLDNNRVVEIPDHGDLVGRVWAVTRADAEGGDAICELMSKGRAVRYRISKTIKLCNDAARVEIKYSLTNEDAFTWPWYWSAHALMHANAGLFIDLPENEVFRVDQLVAGSDVTRDVVTNWPNLTLESGEVLDLSRSFESASDASPFASKIFVPTPESGVVKIVQSGTNEHFSLHYNPLQLPWLGLWINNNGWSGNGGPPYRNLGVEPTTAPYDNVADAITNDSVEWLQSGETRHWSVAVEIHS